MVDLHERSLPPGGSLKYLGGAEATLADANWQEIGPVPVNREALRPGSAGSRMSISCTPQPDATLKIELRVLDPAIHIRSALGITNDAPSR